MNVLFIYPRSRKKLELDYQSGKAPSTDFYGQKELLKLGIHAHYFDWAYERWNILHWILFPFEELFISFTGIGFKLDQALLLLSELRKTDLIISTSDSSGLGIALLRRLRVIQTPHIYTSIGLSGLYKTKKSNLMFSMCKLILQAPDKILCYSPVEKDTFEKEFSISSNKIIFFPPGTDTNFFIPSTKKSENYVLAVGRDSGRDYNLLISVAKELPKVNFHIICSPQNLLGMKIPSNVKVEIDIDYETLRHRYQNSMMVVIPTQETERASGQLVMLGAMACGKPVIISRVKGLTGVYDLKSDSNCILVPPGSPDELKKAIENLSENQKMCEKIGKNGRKLIKSQYSESKYGRLLLRLVNDIVNK